MSPLNNAWDLLKGNTNRDQTGVFGHPMELAFRLLKNYVPDDNETPSSVEQPRINPLEAALSRARNQGPAPAANIDGMRMATQPPKTMEELLAMLKDKQGMPPMGRTLPPPQ